MGLLNLLLSMPLKVGVRVPLTVEMVAAPDFVPCSGMRG